MDRLPRLDFVIKVASRCNLNCSYCYVYNKGDNTWRDRPAIISDAVFRAAVERIRAHCLRSGQEEVGITFHGGEPTLVGPERFSGFCAGAEAALEGIAKTRFSIQTNGTMINERWVDVFRRHDVCVGVSVDGTKEEHDLYRVDRLGRGSYDSVARGLKMLSDGGLAPQALSVIHFGADGLKTHKHLLQLGVRRVGYLLPDFTHDTIGPVRERHGPTPCADFLLPILEDWWANGQEEDVEIILFMDMARFILGGGGVTDELVGNRPFNFVFVESDGAIEGLDVLRVCKEGMAKTGLNVINDDFARIAEVSGLHQAAIFDGVPLPGACKDCPERTTCAGGSLQHRYSSANGFDNRTVWCEDMLALFGRMRQLLGVSVRETTLRRQVLAEMRAETMAGVAPRRGLVIGEDE